MPRIWIGYESARLDGYLVDRKIELPLPPDELAKRLAEARREAKFETGLEAVEPYIADYEGFFPGMEFGTWTRPENLNFLAMKMDLLDEKEKEAVKAYLSENNTEDAIEAFNVCMHANEIDYREYEWGEYKRDRTQGQAWRDSRSKEYRYGYEIVHDNQALHALLDPLSEKYDLCLAEVFSGNEAYEKYGRMHADIYDVILLKNGYMSCDFDDTLYSLKSCGPALTEEWLREVHAKRLWRDLEDVLVDDRDRLVSGWSAPGLGDYPAGTHREDIWRDFEEKLGASVGNLMHLDSGKPPCRDYSAVQVPARLGRLERDLGTHMYGTRILPEILQPVRNDGGERDPGARPQLG